MHGWRQDIADHARTPEAGGEDLLYIFFAHTETSQAKGIEFLGRFLQREEDRDPATDLVARDAQYDAIVEWGIPDHGALQRLTSIQSSTLILQGDNDLMIPTKLSHLMAGLIPDARIHILPGRSTRFPLPVSGIRKRSLRTSTPSSTEPRPTVADTDVRHRRRCSAEMNTTSWCA